MRGNPKEMFPWQLPKYAFTALLTKAEISQWQIPNKDMCRKPNAEQGNVTMANAKRPFSACPTPFLTDATRGAISYTHHFSLRRLFSITSSEYFTGEIYV